VRPEGLSQEKIPVTPSGIEQRTPNNTLKTQIIRLLGYYAAKAGLKPAFQNYLSVPSSRVKLSKLS
jgi:hypothetical protein